MVDGGEEEDGNEDAMLMTEQEKEEFAAQLSELEDRGPEPHVFDASTEGLRRSASAEGRRARSGSGMYERNFRWKQRLHEHTEQLRDEYSAEATKECTFSPTINRSRRGTHSPSEQTSATAQRAADPVETRLSKAKLEKQARLDELRRSSSQHELIGCTFRPRVVKSAWVQQVMPRYLDEAKHPVDQATVDTALQHCSFTPATNRRVAGGLSRATAEYLAAPAHDRLSTAAGKALKRRDHETTLSSIGAATASSVTCAGSRKLQPKLGFFDRLKENEAKCVMSRDKIEQELRAATPFKPVTATYKPRAHPGGSSSTPSDKHHYHADCAVAAAKTREEITGHPAINLASKKLVRTVDDLHNSLRIRRSKIKKLQRHQEEEMMRGATFSPTVSRFSHETGGKLAGYLDGGVESYALFVEMQKSTKEKRLQQLRKELDDRGKEELTFRPVVHEAPALIHEIATEVRKARAVANAAPLTAGGKLASATPVAAPFRF
jgi:hypothetical protein